MASIMPGSAAPGGSDASSSAARTCTARGNSVTRGHGRSEIAGAQPDISAIALSVSSSRIALSPSLLFGCRSIAHGRVLAGLAPARVQATRQRQDGKGERQPSGQRGC
jgi:hypothetical protein